MRNNQPGFKQGRVEHVFETGAITVRNTHSGREQMVWDAPEAARRVGARVWIKHGPPPVVETRE